MFQEFSVNNILIKIAETEEEKQQVYRLRYQDLILDYNKSKVNNLEIDRDDYDNYCDYLIAVDTDIDEVVGTYRLIRREHAQKVGQFLTEGEFNIDKIKDKNGDILEIGRAVVKEKYRDGLVIGLLWKAVIRYSMDLNIKFLFGTASFHGTDPSEYKNCLSYLYYNYLSPDEIRAYAQEDSCCDMKMLEQDKIDLNMVKKEVPPLVKGYAKLGATVGEGVYIDEPFKSVDVFILLETSRINPRYLKRYLED